MDNKINHLSYYDYNLPEELIAQTPLQKRSDSKLMMLDSKSGKTEDNNFENIVDFFKKDDVLVVNNSRVIPARLHGFKSTGGHVEFLLLKDLGQNKWEVLAKPAKKLKDGSKLYFGNDDKNPILTATVLESLEHGGKIVEFHFEGIFLEILEKIGEMPLPPYIHNKLEDKDRYQTFYSKINGSSAAPTAGLHWTPELLDKLRNKGVKIAEITLHVGLGTFRPVEEDDISNHLMHSEFYQIDEEASNIINNAKEKNSRIIATGTTTIRTLETVASKNSGKIITDSGWTDIFIKPGYDWKVVDAFITNFHLPKSTLIMLVSSFAGRDNVINAYKHAVDEKYRFFSFGDAMLVY